MEFGLVGAGVMGQNLALNIERNGFSLAVYDRVHEKLREFLRGKAQGKRIAGADSPGAFIEQLERPRRIILLVNAGGPVDDVIERLTPRLEPGDIIIDGGNSLFADTERRCEELAKKGIRFAGCGVSGGEEGALKGPAIMPGCEKEAYDLIAPMLTRIAAHVEGEPCCAYMGPRGAGHYVKMIHNGIEYAIMQLIAEAYDILRSAAHLSAPEIGGLFEEWGNSVELNSYLFEITAKALKKVEAETGRPLVDLILDTAEQKGTGKWTRQNALDVGVAVPSIDAAVESRMLSSLKSQRKDAAKVLTRSTTAPVEAAVLIPCVRDALHASIIVSYAQGLAQLRTGSAEYKYGLNLAEIAKIWRGGCIIRSAMLEPIRKAFTAKPDLPNLMLDAVFSARLLALQENWRSAVQTAIGAGIPVLAMSASLGYFDAYRREYMPANLLQAQRDFFGAHGYRRLDREGVFHTQWEEKES